MLARMKLLITRVALVLLALCVVGLLWIPVMLIHLLARAAEGRPLQETLLDLRDQAVHDFYTWLDLVIDPFGDDEDEVNGI